MEGWILDVKEKDVWTRKRRAKAQGMESCGGFAYHLVSVEIKAISSHHHFFPSILLGSQSVYLVLEIGQPRHQGFRRVPSKEK